MATLAFYGCGEDDSSVDSGTTPTDGAVIDAGLLADGGLVDGGGADTGTRLDTGTPVDLGPEQDLAVSCDCDPAEPCCDPTCQFLPDTEECGLSLVYTCQGGAGCGATLEFNGSRTFCSGSSAQCNGATVPSPSASMSCGGGNRCVPRTITNGDASGFGSTFGCVPDGSC